MACRMRDVVCPSPDFDIHIRMCIWKCVCVYICMYTYVHFARAVVTKYHQQWLKQEKFIISQLWKFKDGIQMLAGLVPSVGHERRICSRSFSLACGWFIFMFPCTFSLRTCVSVSTFLFPSLSFFFLLFRATPMACGSSQARGLIGATAASLPHSHSNARSELHLQPTPQLTATPDP